MYSKRYRTEYVRWRGGNFAPITVAKLTAVPTTVRVTQGGLSFAPKSAMTHAGVGAFDLDTDGMSKAEVWQLCREGMAVNIIMLPRGFTWDSFQGPTLGNTDDGNEHLHCLDLDCLRSMHPEAQAQVREVLRGGDGLVGGAAYTGPPLHLTKWSKSPYNPNTPENKKKKELELPTTGEVAKALSTDKAFLRAIATAVWSFGIPGPSAAKKRPLWSAAHLFDWSGRRQAELATAELISELRAELAADRAGHRADIAALTALVKGLKP